MQSLTKQYGVFKRIKSLFYMKIILNVYKMKIKNAPHIQLRAPRVHCEICMHELSAWKI